MRPIAPAYMRFLLVSELKNANGMRRSSRLCRDASCCCWRYYKKDVCSFLLVFSGRRAFVQRKKTIVQLASREHHSLQKAGDGKCIETHNHNEHHFSLIEVFQNYLLQKIEVASSHLKICQKDCFL